MFPRDFIQLLEESSKRRESRLRQESELHAEQYESRLQQMNTEQTKLEQTYQQRLQQVIQDHTQQVDRIQQGHRYNSTSASNVGFYMQFILCQDYFQKPTGTSTVPIFCLIQLTVYCIIGNWKYAATVAK